MFLYLDDTRTPTDKTSEEIPKGNWRIVRNYNEFIAFITKHGLPDLISFDHDLSFEHQSYYMENAKYYLANPKAPIPYTQFKEKTGHHCAKWLTEYCLDNKLKLPRWQVHSMNPVGKQNIIGLLTSFEKFQRDNC